MPASLSPYIAESIRRRRLEREREREQLRVLEHAMADIAPELGALGLTARQKVAQLRWRERTKRASARTSRRRRARKAGAHLSGRVDRDEIIKRDNATCYLCGKHCEPDEIHLDHVVPLSRGGAHGPENVKVACASCNIAKGASLLPPSQEGATV